MKDVIVIGVDWRGYAAMKNRWPLFVPPDW